MLKKKKKTVLYKNKPFSQTKTKEVLGNIPQRQEAHKGKSLLAFAALSAGRQVWGNSIIFAAIYKK